MKRPTQRRPGLDVRRALRAARELVHNPDDLPKVFTVIESLSGGTMSHIRKRLERSEGGRRLLGDQPQIVEHLIDRAHLAALPEGSLGRAYLAFVEREGISAEGIRDAASQGESGHGMFDGVEAYVHQRMRDTHDLWHAAIGYGGDILGEVALLAFTLAQTRNPAIALLVGVGLVKTIGSPVARATILEGFRRGRSAAWLPEQEWESMLALPLDEVRDRLRLGAPPVYVPVTTAELRAERAAAA
jgi:ubiquinone biosynthesis protein COQ4